LLHDQLDGEVAQRPIRMPEPAPSASMACH
jgi:hypothetical protein